MENNPLFGLVLRRIVELGQVALEAHQKLEQWRDPPLTSHERTMISLELKGALEEQKRWILAIEEYLEGE